MEIGRILFPVHELGPGNRLGIWVQGCQKRCKGCANPELQHVEKEKNISYDILDRLVKNIVLYHCIDGVTITGGEPFLQAEELYKLLRTIKSICDDILVYTGYTYEELKNRNDIIIEKCFDCISVLVDGSYEEELNMGERLRGSTNQNIIYLDEKKIKTYEEYMNSGQRQIENFNSSDGIISVGIHPQGFIRAIQGCNERVTQEKA